MARRKSDGTAIDQIVSCAALNIKKTPPLVALCYKHQSELIDYKIINVLVFASAGYDGYAVSSGDLIADIGESGRRIAGRLKVLEANKLIREVPRSEAESLFADKNPKRGKAYVLGPVAKRRIAAMKRGRKAPRPKVVR